MADRANSRVILLPMAYIDGKSEIISHWPTDWPTDSTNYKEMLSHLKRITRVFQIDGSGKMICAGAGDGTTSVLKLDESLINNSKLDRNNASDMFERFDIKR